MRFSSCSRSPVGCEGSGVFEMRTPHVFNYANIHYIFYLFKPAHEKSGRCEPAAFRCLTVRRLVEIDCRTPVLRFFDAVAGLDDEFTLAATDSGDSAIGHTLGGQVRFGSVRTAFR